MEELLVESVWKAVLVTKQVDMRRLVDVCEAEQ